MTKQTNTTAIEKQIMRVVDGEVQKPQVFDEKDKTFHSGLDPLDDTQISIASKTRFMEWWRLNTNSYPVRNHRGVVDAGKVVRLNYGMINIVGATFSCLDCKAEEMPFKMGECDSFVIEMPNLHSYKNTPRSAKGGAQYGTLLRPMRYLDTLVGGVEHATAVMIYTESTFLNLETSLKQDNLQELQINAPSLATFEGLNTNVTYLRLNLSRQKSFKGIHRAIDNSVANVCCLSIGIGSDFEGGVLPFAMMDPSIEVVADVVGSSPQDFIDAMAVVSEQRKLGLNVHEIQERLFDVGLGKYARL
ncbi:MAG: hypothetical protein KGI25_08125 [Thaumarchaeota archaeon]|nr:hypothetical protein [Nitrososphaerota archaeon]